MSVARLNFSHGNLEDHREDIRRIRSVAAQLNREVMVLVDLPGPKIRIGKLQNEPLVLKKGDYVTLTTQEILGTASRVSVNYPRLPESVSRGSRIYLNDGLMKLRVQGVLGNEVRCKVVVGGQLISKRGLNLPRVKLLIDAVTDKDLDFVDFGLKERVDAFSVSFVEKAEDIVKVKEFARKRGKPIYVVAKIEREEAVKNISEILKEADAIMVARGDLGVQIPLEEVPAVQKQLIHKANLLGRPVITATQMLESMKENVRPTRAEVTDVANAILDGTDAVMLSEETARGRYPVRTVRTMARIARTIERQRRRLNPSSSVKQSFMSGVGQKTMAIEDVVSLNVIEAMRALNARFILTPTDKGNTPRRISRFKPDCWILAFSKCERTRRFLSLSYGVYSFFVEKKVDSWHDLIMKFIKDARLGKRGDNVILTEDLSSGQASGTDSLRIVTLE
jgi:pyruvate kinase